MHLTPKTQVQKNIYIETTVRHMPYLKITSLKQFSYVIKVKHVPHLIHKFKTNLDLLTKMKHVPHFNTTSSRNFGSLYKSEGWASTLKHKSREIQICKQG